MFSYKEFLEVKNEPIITEGAIGNVLKSVKDKFALSISKRIGGAKKIDKAIDLRKIELKDILNIKLKMEEDLLLSKRAFEKSDDDESLRTQYEQLKKSITGQMGAINKKEKASKKKFDLTFSSLTKNSNDSVKGYAEMQEADMNMELAEIELQSYKKMGRDSTKIEAKIKKQSDIIDAKKKEIKDSLRKTKEESKEVIKIDSDKTYNYMNSKGVQLEVKILSSEADDKGFWKVVNIEKENDSTGFKVKAEDLKAKVEKTEKK